MDHRSVQRGVARLQCGAEQGTATIIGPTVAIATRHSILDHLESRQVPIELHLTDPATTLIASLHPVNIPNDEDIVLLELANAVEDSATIQLSAAYLPVEQEWSAFGFPSARRAGAWIDGKVGTWLPQGERPHDVELSVNNFRAVRNYRGYSGGPVLVDGRVVAFLQRQLDGGLASTSVLRLRRYLDGAGIRYRSQQSARSAPPKLRAIANEARPNFQTYWALEDALRSTTPGYRVLFGPAGSGKTIVAAGFTAIDTRLRVVAAYFAGGDADPAGLPPELHRDPAAFAAWLAQETALSTEMVVASRSSDGIKEHAASVQQNLAALGAHYRSRNELGVIFIDDFCGLLGGQVDGTLGRVLPTTPPEGVAIVLTAASGAYVRTAAPHLNLASTTEVARLELYDCERIVAHQFGNSLQRTDVLRIASAAAGNPLILSYLVREAKGALAGGLPLPDVHAAVPTAQAFYEQLWARLAGQDASIWLMAFVTRLRGRMPEVELSPVLPDFVRAGLQTAWRTVGHLVRKDASGVEAFHSSFREFVLSRTEALDRDVHDCLAEHCARASSDYAVSNLIHHHLRGSEATLRQAPDLFTQNWLDDCAARFTPPAYVLSDVQDLLHLSLSSGSLTETIRLLLARSRVRFRYGDIFGKYAYELACVVSSMRTADAGLRLVLHDDQLVCTASEAVELIKRLLLAQDYDAATELYQAMRRVCFAQYQTNDITLLSLHVEALGLLMPQLGQEYQGELRFLFRMLDKAVRADGADPSLFRECVRSLPAAGLLWRFGWFVQSTRLRETAPKQYAIELSTVLDHANAVARRHGVPSQAQEPPPSNETFCVFTADEAAAELEVACRAHQPQEGILRSTIDVLMRHGRDPQVVAKLAESLAKPEGVQVRKANGVDADTAALDDLFRWSAISSYLQDSAIRDALPLGTREPWEKRFLDALSWLGATHGRLCRERRDSGTVAVDLIGDFLPKLTFTLAERSLWKDSYALPEALLPLLIVRLCEILTEFAPELAATVSTWAIENPHAQLGLYAEGYRTTLWELAEGLSFCDDSVARSVWRAHLTHTVATTQNREERVPALLACAQGAADLGDLELAEMALVHAVSSSMGPSWYKEDQFTLLVDTLSAAGHVSLTKERWQDIVRLLEHASGDVTFQRFVRYEKEKLVRLLAESGSVANALALVTNYLWPDEQTQLDRIQSWRADHISPIDGGRHGVMEVARQASALALLPGLTSAAAMYRWALVEVFLPGDLRHFSAFARLVPELFKSPQSNVIKGRLIRLLLADFVPEQRSLFVNELRGLGDSRIDEWLQALEREYEWARVEKEAASPRPPPNMPPTKPYDRGRASKDDLVLPGVFGKSEGHSALEDAVALANQRRERGDLAGARDLYIQGLGAAQAAGWSIWEGSSRSEDALRGVFDTGDLPASVRALQSLILAEEYALDWRVALALIEVALPRKDVTLAAPLLDVVFAHARAMLAPEMATPVDYEVRNLDTDTGPRTAEQAVVLFLLSSLDDACCHFRDRAATTLRWLLVSDPHFRVELLLDRALHRVGGHSREICLGLMHSWCVESPDAARPALTALPQFDSLMTDASFAARYVGAMVKGTPLAIGQRNLVDEPGSVTTDGSREQSAPSIVHGWRSDCNEILRIAGPSSSISTATQHLAAICGGFEAAIVVGLWRVRREAAASKDFWSSPYEREAVWRSVLDNASDHFAELADELMWNPQWPDAAVAIGHGGVCERIFARVREEDFEDCFLVDGRLLLHCREAAFDANSQTASQLEIVAVLVPSAYFTGEFNSEFLFEPRSTHGAQVRRSSIIAAPVEPAVAKFRDRRGWVGGSMTPAQPSQAFLALTSAPPEAFQRANWRLGREWEPFGVGRPLYDGTILTVDAAVSVSLTGMDVVWCLLRDGERVALIHPAQRTAFSRGDL